MTREPPHSAIVYLVRNLGMRRALEGLIAHLKNTAIAEPYEQTLIEDLETALRNYEARYADEEG